MLEEKDHAKIISIFKFLESQERTYVIYGAGIYARSLLSLITEQRLQLPLYIADDNPRDDFIDGIPVIHTNTLKSKNFNEIILGSDTYQDEMRSSLCKQLDAIPPAIDLCKDYHDVSENRPSNIKLIFNGRELATGFFNSEKCQEDMLRHSINAFITGISGAQYGLKKQDKLDLIKIIYRNLQFIPSVHDFMFHVHIARHLLALPADMEGKVIECGAFKGALSSTLSLVCNIADRELVICDTFEGMPNETPYRYVDLANGKYGVYTKGMFKASQEELKANISKYAKNENITILKGPIEETLKSFNNDAAFVALDLVLPSSTRKAVSYLWSKLAPEGKLILANAHDFSLKEIFFDHSWWKNNFECEPPGLTDLCLCIEKEGSDFSYAAKAVPFDKAAFERLPYLEG